jgi:HSP20 family molecular chaperone IbpA
MTNEQNNTEFTVIPSVDIIEEKEGYRLIADMPGVTKDSLEVTIDNRDLTITGRVKPSENGKPAYSEFEHTLFKRKFVLNEEIDSKGINASLTNGVLVLTLPKSEDVKPRTIQIKTA